MKTSRAAGPCSRSTASRPSPARRSAGSDAGSAAARSASTDTSRASRACRPCSPAWATPPICGRSWPAAVGRGPCPRRLLAAARRRDARDAPPRRGLRRLEQAENVLVGDDGFPYLIDFQIACRCGPSADHALGRWWLARLQREDLYHALEHKRRFARESMTSYELTSVRQRSVLIRLHRLLNHPYRMVRRPLFRWLRRTGRVLSSAVARLGWEARAGRTARDRTG